MFLRAAVASCFISRLNRRFCTRTRTFRCDWKLPKPSLTSSSSHLSLAEENNVKNLVYECFLRRAEIHQFSHFECGRQIAANRLDGVLRSEFLEIYAKTFSVHYSRPEIENMFYNIHAERKGNKRKKVAKVFRLFFAVHFFLQAVK